MSIANDMRGIGVELRQGQPVGYCGWRAYVREVDGDDVVIDWKRDLPPRDCGDCNGTGELVMRQGPGRVYLQGCPACQATGSLPASSEICSDTVKRWQISEPPAREQADRESVKLAVDLMKKAGLAR